MTDADALANAAPEGTSTLDLLELGIIQAVEAAKWQTAHMACPFGAPNLRHRLAAIAVNYEDAARETLNRVRVALGGDPVPDPAEPPPARPDD